jgi:phosphatidylcholine synthase
MERRGRGPERKQTVRPASAAAAFSVHVFTALGAACALFALLAAIQDAWVAMFGWLGLALVIDGIDGTIARRMQVAVVLPRWSGDALDLVVDFTTYVFVPAFALMRSGLLPEVAAIPLGAAIVVSGAIYCADRNMKPDDGHFRGFPILWNAAAFHLFVLKLPPWVAAGVVAALVIMSFASYRTIHPLRVERLMVVNRLALLTWALLGLYALYRDLQPGLWAALALTALSAYFMGIGALLSRR